MGEKRSLALLAQNADVSHTTLRNYSRDFNWQDRLIERAEAIAKKSDDVVIELASKFRRQQVQYLIKRLAQFHHKTKDDQLVALTSYIDLSALLYKALKQDEEQHDTKIVIINPIPGS